MGNCVKENENVAKLHIDLVQTLHVYKSVIDISWTFIRHDINILIK